MTYYNENDPKIAAWLRELIKAGLIPNGYVDERSIVDVKPHELTSFIQQHFFAGVGGWAYALRLSGWADEKPVRTGSCPCQPFSQAGKKLAAKDERHLWPVFRDIITFGDSTITFGEQVSGPLGREWLAGVRADLEGLGYEVGAADLCAACISAPHIRQRLYWVAYADKRGWSTGSTKSSSHKTSLLSGQPSKTCGQVQSNGSGCEQGQQGTETAGYGSPIESASGASGLGDSSGGRRGEQRNKAFAPDGGYSDGSNPWSDFDICNFTGYEAGKVRRIESKSFPLASRLPGDLDLLRGYGNSIIPQLAAEFIRACEEALA